MKIEINFDDIELIDWCEADEYGVNAPTLKEIFKQEILQKFVDRVNYDREIKKYIQDNIAKGLYATVQKYQTDMAIDEAVRSVIAENIQQRGTRFFLGDYDYRVKASVDKYLESIKKEMYRSIDIYIEGEIKKIIREFEKGSVLAQFLDYKKLAAYVLKTMQESDVKIISEGDNG